MGRLRYLREQARDNPNMVVLAMSAGDDLIGSVIDELLGDESNKKALHAGYCLYTIAGIDVCYSAE